ncbi:MAG: ABC transporter substrate binding protein, partial [Thermoguttaceae bacterium]
MLQIFRRILLSLVLLGAGATTLLLSDLRSRRSKEDNAGPPPKRRVAILKHASNRLLDELEGGVLERLAAAGYRDGERLSLRRFSAEGDLTTANAIAREVTDGSYDLVITISTLSLQCVANANKDGRVIHVFGGVTDPVGAGVGVRRMDSTDKPAWLTGIGSFQPVDEIFREARVLWPGLKKVGVVWNPTERNSEICVLKARQVCSGLGVELLEANVEQSKDVGEAAQSLIERGVEAFWTGIDVTVLNATAVLCETALKARMPVFSNTTGQVQDGTLFDLGANYAEVGQRVGELAASILDGADPATIAITNFMPERVMLNRRVLTQMRDPWRFPDELTGRAALVVGEDGLAEKQVRPSEPPAQAAKLAAEPRAAAPAASAPPRKWRIQQVSYSESVMLDDSMRGFHDGLKEAGLSEGKDYTLRTLSAQGDMAALGSLFDSAETTGTDLYVVYSTPTLQTALQKVRSRPVVFTMVADPFAAGAGKSDSEHAANVTGVYTQGPYRELVALLRKYFPQIRRIGTLFCPAEVNSVSNKEMLVREATRA